MYRDEVEELYEAATDFDDAFREILVATIDFLDYLDRGDTTECIYTDQLVEKMVKEIENLHFQPLMEKLGVLKEKYEEEQER